MFNTEKTFVQRTFVTSTTIVEERQLEMMDGQECIDDGHQTTPILHNSSKLFQVHELGIDDDPKQTLAQDKDNLRSMYKQDVDHSTTPKASVADGSGKLLNLRIEAPRYAFGDFVQKCMEANLEFDKTSLSKVLEAQEDAKHQLEVQYSMLTMQSESKVETEVGKVMKEFVLMHSKQLYEAFYQTLSAKEDYLKRSLEQQVEKFCALWEKHTKAHVEMFSSTIRYLKEDHKQKLAQARGTATGILDEKLKRAQEELRRNELQLKEQFNTERREMIRRFTTRATILEQKMDEETKKTRSMANVLVDSNQQIRTLQMQNQASERRITELQGELDAANGKFQGKAANAQVFIQVLQRQLKSALQKIDTLEEINREKDLDIERYSIALERANNQSETLTNKLETTESLLSVLRDDLKTQKDEIISLTTERNGVRDELKHAKDHILQLKAEFDEMKLKEETTRFELEKTIRQHKDQEALLLKEREILNAKIHRYDTIFVDLHRDIAEKAEKIEELTLGMMEYARLQKKFNKMIEQQKKLEKQQQQQQKNQGRQQNVKAFNASKRNNITYENGVWVKESAQDIEEQEQEQEMHGDGNLPMVTKEQERNDSSYPTKPIAVFMMELANKRKHNKSKASSTVQPSSTKITAKEQEGEDSISKKDEPASMMDQFMAETEQVRARMEKELRETLEEEIKASVRSEYLSELKTDLENRLRREISVQYRLKMQTQLRKELKILTASSKEEWSKVLAKQETEMEQIKTELKQRDREIARMNHEVDHLKADTNWLIQSVREKDTLLEQMTNILQKTKHRIEHNSHHGTPMLPLALVTVNNNHNNNNNDNSNKDESTKGGHIKATTSTSLARPNTAPRERTNKMQNERVEPSQPRKATVEAVALKYQQKNKKTIVFGRETRKGILHRNKHEIESKILFKKC